ncbi:hypothetical protein, partial [Methanimicrococcus hacksteinii]|uniref:hypothetical protein n=1 Tax=Methanimicrococcus hacksteinii TaxID=3028293 RepID=UPI00298EEAAC
FFEKLIFGRADALVCSALFPSVLQLFFGRRSRLKIAKRFSANTRSFAALKNCECNEQFFFTNVAHLEAHIKVEE